MKGETAGPGIGFPCSSQPVGMILPLGLCPGQTAGCGVVLGVMVVGLLGVVPSFSGTSMGSCLMTGVPLLESSEETDEGRDWLYSDCWG